MSIPETHPPRLSPDEIKIFVRSSYGIDAVATRDLGSYIDQNIHITASSGGEYLLKVHDAREHEAVLDLQNKVMEHLSENIDDVTFPHAIISLAGKEIETLQGADGCTHYARILSFIPGTLLKEVTPVPFCLLEDIGRIAGEMDAALENFYHPASNRPDIPWDLKNATRTGRLSRYIESPHKRRIAEYFLLKFDNEVAPALGELRKSVVHGDTHRFSILLEESHQRVSGIIDFGDVVYTHTVCNLAVCLSDMAVNQKDPIAAASELVGAYHQAYPLGEAELSILFPLMCTRLAIYVSMATYTRVQGLKNDHALSKEEDIWALMERLVEINPLHALESFRIACGFPSLQPAFRQRGDSNLQQRQKYFARSMYTHYEEPLHLSGGALQYLHDDGGRSYLDCVNNVCQWGHCHPYIVRSAQQQMAKLNTNSRYVYDIMTEYADRLLATLPDPLNVCFLVNSGSEANDLALRLARTFTGKQDVIVVDRAYHGNSTVCTEISPHRVDRPGKPGLGSYVHKCVVPDTFRGEFGRDDPLAGEKYAAHVRTLIEEKSLEGKGVAAFIAESLIGTGGQIVLPENYLRSAYKHVRDSGGLCIADEVQMGFGRVGTHMWCFETQQVVPDIVTMGKPMGNGHPMAAVVTTREIAEAYDDGGVTYFNTFGGNPVSCATGLAVLDVLQNEELQQNTAKMSALLFDGLETLKSRYPVIADVRGLGLYIGVELVEDRDTLRPATALAGVVVEEMKSRGILLNTNGYDNNIIKIKPPLIISERDVNRLLQYFDEVFSQL
ncbi:aminotransferase class III-fold pyridoxal phosphate-dependent enzyme [Luminiphilus sp.]|nr:aminotransferase class III-fold pyridoxal phosphate-dependent enzyme [Luminiphilus sp.]